MNKEYIHKDTRTDEPLQVQIETLTRWQDPTIKEYKKEIERLNNIIDLVVKDMEMTKYNPELPTYNSCVAVDKDHIQQWIDKLKELSEYGNKDRWDNNSKVKCVCDEQIYDNVREGKQVLALIEPRSIQPNVYNYVLDHFGEYEYVFTGDDMLLNSLSNAKPIMWGGVWYREENPTKTKLICMYSSDKEMCDLHKERKRIGRKYRGKIDVFGTIDGGEYVYDNKHKDYMYEVVIENDRQNIWFTEKICNCFANKTIPIYYGARDIGKYFNKDGIIICDSIEEVEEHIDDILSHEEEYTAMYGIPAIDENYELSKKYEKFDDWFYTTYEKEIDSLFEGGDE